MNRITTRIVAGALCLLAVAGAPAAALAQEDTRTTLVRTADLDTLKLRAIGAIDARLIRIDRLRAQVGAAGALTSDHEAQLGAELGRAESGLTALRAEIEAAQAIEALRRLIPKIAEDYRIYVLVTPKVHLVIASDTVTAAADTLDEVAGRLAGTIEEAAAAGYDTGEAEAALEEMQSAIAQARRVGSPVAGSVLPLTPADWEEPAHGLLTAGHDDIIEARRHLRDAREAARDVVRALREAAGNES